MQLAETIRKEIATIFKTRWSRRDGRVVPENEEVGLGNDGVDLEGVVLYADLVDSTEMVNRFRDWFAAEMYKAYLSSTCRVIRENGGEITAFDGDRVMAVFLGANKNSMAAKAGLQINYVVKKIINPAIRAQYPKTAFVLRQVVGIDAGSLLVARTGIRNSNDLVWVGRAANYAAKLCGVRDEEQSTFITEAVHSKLNSGSKYGGSPRRTMWEKRLWDLMGVPIYASKWWWPLA